MDYYKSVPDISRLTIIISNVYVCELGNDCNMLTLRPTGYWLESETEILLIFKHRVIIEVYSCTHTVARLFPSDRGRLRAKRESICSVRIVL